MSSQRLDTPRWIPVCFPNTNIRDQFLYHVRLWNLVHDLPPIAVEPVQDGVRVRLRSPSPSTTRLLAAFGGRLQG